MSRPYCDYQFKELEWEKRERLARKKGHKPMNTFEQLMLEEISKTLKQMSVRLDDIASRLPMPTVKKEYKDIAFEKREGTGDGNFKYPTTYVSVQTKTTDSTND